MSKEQINDLPETVVEMATTVTYKGEKLQATIRFDVNNLAQLVKSKGPEAANNSMKTLTEQLYSKTNENLKQLINK